MICVFGPKKLILKLYAPQKILSILVIYKLFLRSDPKSSPKSSINT